MAKTIKHIICTGGPCSGKSTFLSRVEEIFSERGYRVLVDHETATDLITGGISPATLGMYEFQKYCIGLQLKKEELYEQAANEIEGDKVLIFYDRGIIDDKGYVPNDFEEILSTFNKTEEECKNHYDLVMHLTTAAKGGDDLYTTANNAARYENSSMAREVDDTIRESWAGHPNIVVINSEEDFDLKMRKAIQAVFSFLKEEKPTEASRKYLVKNTPDIIEKLEETSSKTHILQHYLLSNPGFEKRIRAREKDGTVLYYYSESTIISPNVRNKRDRFISLRQYDDYMLEVDKTLSPIDKERYSFYNDNHYYRYDVFSFDKTKAILSVQLADENDEVTIPEGFEVIKDVTDMINYKNYYLAKTQKYM